MFFDFIANSIINKEIHLCIIIIKSFNLSLVLVFDFNNRLMSFMKKYLNKRVYILISEILHI